MNKLNPVLADLIESIFYTEGFRKNSTSKSEKAKVTARMLRKEELLRAEIITDWDAVVETISEYIDGKLTDSEFDEVASKWKFRNS